MEVASSMKKVVVMENPLAMSDEQVLEQVSHFHVGKGREPFNVKAFFKVVSAVMRQAIGIADPSIIKTNEVEKVVPSKLEPPTKLLKHLCCQMRETRDDEYHISAHKTTMSILEQLKAYSWDAKAVTALAAFSLEYGNFWHLSQVRKDDNLGTSLALLNRVQAFESTRKDDRHDYNLMVSNVHSTVENIVKLEYMLKQNHDERSMPTLVKAMHIFPAFVYWTMLTIVACASHTDLLLGYADGKYELSNISSKISTFRIQTRDLLAKLEREKAWMEEYQGRVRVVIQTPTEIVQVLKNMLFPLPSNPQVYHDFSRRMVSIEEFRDKYVVMFISGLYSIGDEIRLLKSIYDYLQKGPKEVKGFRKDVFKILWVPIVEDKEINSVEQNKMFSEWRSQMEWYVMDPHHIPTMCKKLIREKIGFQDDPVVPVFNPQGRRIKDDALHTMFVWDGSAFPWRPEDDDALTQKWNWLWAKMKRKNAEIDEWIKKERYIFIYGRSDSDLSENKMLASLAKAVEAVRGDSITKKADVFINDYHYGKGTVGEEHQSARRFWSHVEATFHNMKKKATPDRAFDEVKDVLGLRQEPSGWVLLSKGSIVTQVCRGDLAYQTLSEFDAWKSNINMDPSFDVSFRRHYETLAAKLPPHTRCLHLELRTHLEDASGPLECIRCRRPMALEMIKYVCCHHDVAIDRKTA